MKEIELLFFWATWCPICVREAKPEWDKFVSENKTISDYNIVFRDVNCSEWIDLSQDFPEKTIVINADDTDEIIEIKHKLKIIRDEQRRKDLEIRDSPQNKELNVLMDKYKVEGYPTIVLVTDGEYKTLEDKVTYDNIEKFVLQNIKND